ncbi:hypothetical protein AB1K32_07710 [Metabacillus dongyingensis]|uniref:hypothetical protein n=1 Tax=Metabacillus dongyingensis TaxID=2874282 RepID=UPI003B8E031D
MNAFEKQETLTGKIGTEDGSSFIGDTIITKYEYGPLGSTVILNGKKELVQV